MLLQNPADRNGSKADSCASKVEGVSKAADNGVSEGGDGGWDGTCHLTQEQEVHRAMADSCIQLLSYLEHAAEVARDKFCRFHLGVMVAGCALMVVSVMVHVTVMAK